MEHMDRCEQMDRWNRWIDVNGWTEGTDGQMEQVDGRDRGTDVNRWTEGTDRLGCAMSAGDLQVSTGYLPKNTCRSRIRGSGSTCSHGSHQIQVSVSDIYHICRSYLCILM